MAIKSENIIREGIVVWKINIIIKGNDIEAIIEESETYLVVSKTTINIIIDANAAFGWIANIIPN